MEVGFNGFDLIDRIGQMEAIISIGRRKFQPFPTALPFDLPTRKFQRKRGMGVLSGHAIPCSRCWPLRHTNVLLWNGVP
jgi:hypothetical protein